VRAPPGTTRCCAKLVRVSSRRSQTIVLLALVVSFGATACSSGTSTTTPSTAPTTAATATTGGTTTSEVRHTPTTTANIGHVFVINLENEDYATTWGPSSPATYLNGTLRAKGQLLTQYFAVGHASLPNYIAQISGQAPNPDTQGDCVTDREFATTGTGAYGQALGKGCVYPTPVKTIADQLDAVGKTWTAYQEDMGNSPTDAKTCRHPRIGTVDKTFLAPKGDLYVTRHDPFVYFHSIIDTPRCAKDVVGLDGLTRDLQSEATTPNLSYITPNVCNDGHDAPCSNGKPGGLTSADAWLGQWVPKILASPAFRADGLLVITLDEAQLGSAPAEVSACCHTPPSPNVTSPGLSGPGGGNVGALILSRFTKPGTTNSTPYNHYSLLCSMENIWGLSHLGFAGAPGLNCFGSDVYDRPRGR
jgi:hypothetical protein